MMLKGNMLQAELNEAYMTALAKISTTGKMFSSDLLQR